MGGGAVSPGASPKSADEPKEDMFKNTGGYYY